MEALVFLLLVVIAACFVLPLVAITKAAAARRSVEDFETRLRSLEAELQVLKRTPAESAAEQPLAVEREAEEAEPGVRPTVVQPSSRLIRQSKPITSPPAARMCFSSPAVPVLKLITGTPGVIPAMTERVYGRTKCA